jgi:hypothetical protein
MTTHTTHIGVIGTVGIILAIVALGVWILMIMRARRHPDGRRRDAEKLKRGPVSGGAIHGDPGQSILTGEADRIDDEEHKNA